MKSAFGDEGTHPDLPLDGVGSESLHTKKNTAVSSKHIQSVKMSIRNILEVSVIHLYSGFKQAKSKVKVSRMVFPIADDPNFV
jgi:hypothetical protein